MVPVKEILIKIAGRNDTPRLQRFINEHWRKDHIFTRNESFFLHEYQSNQGLNFVIAENELDEIIGILGFISYEPDIENSDIFLAIWKVNPGSGEPGLGIKLLQFLIETSKCSSVSCVGVNPSTLPIYEYLGYTTGQMDHYYMANDKKGSFRIAVNIEAKRAITESSSQFRLSAVTDAEKIVAIYQQLLSKNNCKPRKSGWYFNKRFIEHPIYKYDFFVIREADKPTCLLVLRKVEINGSRIYRIIDVIGDQSGLQHVAGSLRELLYRTDSEYIDLYQYGIPSAVLLNAGFIKVEKDGETIIPDYFNPFVSKNIPIYYFTTLKNGYAFFKGDGDQDRPS